MPDERSANIGFQIKHRTRSDVLPKLAGRLAPWTISATLKKNNFGYTYGVPQSNVNVLYVGGTSTNTAVYLYIYMQL